MAMHPRTVFHLGTLIVATVAAALIGRLSWDGSSPLYALAVLPPLWWLLPRRSTMAASVFAYYFSSLVPVAENITGYYQTWSMAAGWAMLVVLAAVNSAPWIAGWAAYGASPARRLIGLVAALALSVLPPLGVIAWVHPLLSAGWLYPGGGWWALLLVVLMWGLIAWLPRPSSLGLAVVSSFAVALAMGSRFDPPPAPEDVVGISTQLVGASTYSAFAQKLNLIDADLRAAQLRSGQIAVLPETTLDEFKAPTVPMINFALWRHIKRGPILAGTTFEEDGAKWAGAVLLRDGAPPLLIKARQPLVFSLWHPWDPDDHYSADWSAQGVFNVGRQRIALRVCSEDFSLFWTLKDFAVDRPTLIVSMSNHWWTRSSLVAKAQAQHLAAAARLFGVAVVRAENRPMTRTPGDARSMAAAFSNH